MLSPLENGFLKRAAAHFRKLWLLGKALTESLRSRMSLGDPDNNARKICSAWLVGREQTKWTQLWFLGWKILNWPWTLTIFCCLNHNTIENQSIQSIMVFFVTKNPDYVPHPKLTDPLFWKAKVWLYLPWNTSKLDVMWCNVPCFWHECHNPFRSFVRSTQFDFPWLRTSKGCYR